MSEMLWRLSWCADPRAAALADRHYSRQKVGSDQFMPPGRKLVFLTEARDAVWGTSWPFPEYVNRDWADAFVCTIFRNESEHLSSVLIRQAVAATRCIWPATPSDGMVTFIDAGKVRRKRDPGRCFRKAGFQPCGTTKGGLIVLRLRPEDMPEPEPPIGWQPMLEGLTA